jgi:HEAT repeat protein
VVPVMSAVEQMGRSDAVRVLARVAECGPGATDALIRGLGSNKAYVRQGCALALALIGSETAVEALSDALLAEPSAVWREIARALGRVGPPAILPLASPPASTRATSAASAPPGSSSRSVSTARSAMTVSPPWAEAAALPGYTASMIRVTQSAGTGSGSVTQ